MKFTLHYIKYGYFIIASIIGVLIFLVSLRYWQPDFSTGFLSNKKDAFPVYGYFLYAHIIASPIALAIGFLQFSWKGAIFHKAIGKVYVYAILGLAAPSGLYMSFYAIGGWIGTAGFASLAVLWAFSTYLAFFWAKKGDFSKHEEWMIRSFILTNSAIALRLLSFINHHYQPLPPTLAYQLIAWLSWLPFLLFYETRRFMVHRKP